MTDTTPVPAAPTLKTFADFAVDARICSALDDAGISNPFPIQELTLPLALAGADLIGQARTGTGKTLAFGIPLLQRALNAGSGVTGALVIVPTRELCLQVRDDLARAASQTDLSVVAVYGGKAIDVQVDALQRGAEVVVGTPGRLLDLLRRGSLNLSGVTALVLDEADEMLDLGFLPDVEQLIQATADKRQTLLFSATMPSAVVALARRYMNKPTFMRADIEEVRIGPDTVQHFFSCHRMDKPAVLARILTSPGRGLCVVFSRTKRMADVLVEDLRAQGVNAAAIHSDLRQDARERALKAFRSGKIDVLVATEVAARGLDISDVTHVVNYDCPDDEKMYLHRIGRTGRAGAAGVAVTLAVWNELARLEMIKKTLGIVQETHEVFSTSPILEELFDLPPRETAKRAPAAAPAKRAPAAAKPSRKAADEAATEVEVVETAAAADDDAEAPKSRSSRRRRGGRGRGPRATTDAEPTEDTTAPAPVAAVAEVAQDAAGASTDDDSGDDAATDDDTTARSGDEVIRRVRTRKRAEGSGDAAERAPRPAATPTKPAARTRTRTRTEPASKERTERTPRESSGRSGGSAKAEAGASRSRRSSERGGAARGDGRGSRNGRSGPRREPAVVDVGEARGDGRPRLARPLVIAYLP